MKKISTIVLGLSLLASSALSASTLETKTLTNHSGDHMHEGMMKNHMNANEMTSTQMKHNQMRKETSTSNNKMNPYTNNMSVDGYKVTLSSMKSLSDGKNMMAIMLMKNGKAIQTAEVNITFFMPAMPGMEFTENAKNDGNAYISMVNFSMGGEWGYELKFKTSDSSTHTTKGRVNIK